MADIRYQLPNVLKRVMNMVNNSRTLAFSPDSPLLARWLVVRDVFACFKPRNQVFAMEVSQSDSPMLPLPPHIVYSVICLYLRDFVFSTLEFTYK